MVERLAARAGVLKPRLYLLERGPLLSLSAGRGRVSSALAGTPGLVALQSPAGGAGGRAKAQALPSPARPAALALRGSRPRELGARRHAGARRAAVAGGGRGR